VAAHARACRRLDPQRNRKAMHEPDQHVSPIKNWKQLVVVVALAFIVPITVIILLSQFVTDHPVEAGVDDTAVLNRIKPVGNVVLAAPSGPRGQLTGEQVFGQVCKTCHEAGLAGAPKFGDRNAWGKVIAQGQATAVDHAIKGIRAMPPKGGNPDFENVEVERGVVYMANQAGANWKAPAVEAAAVVATSAPAASPAPAAATPVVAASPAAAPAKADGKKTYDTTCTACHATGVAGAPKFGDKAAWAPRIKTGIDALYASALRGKGAMPAKGGNASLPDADVKAAVDYMVAAGK
jgi:cytochrome c5